jgi:hypothetical protein
MNKLARGAILSSLFIIATTGCGLVYKVLLGVDSTPEWKTDKEIAREAHKHKISPDNNLLLDTAIYYHQLNETYSKLFAELDFSEIDSSEYSIYKGRSKMIVSPYNSDYSIKTVRRFSKSSTAT